ncbi:kinesin heavy chain-like isoform X3 [Sphaerodactylus townsendi]|uniref:kinesin heavy chain-like isoform X3 n=1 Tax=Sphaerodactylus townsendi TaxID=933632 RepID=UPI002025EDD8|nr:kinesin heavy chain-like isoform X3 [Sphaerodactylus townsendi]
MDMLSTADDSYQREVVSLEYTLQREADRNKMLKDQMEDLLAQYKKLQSDHKRFIRRTHEQTETGQRLLVDLVKQNKALEEEMEQTEAYEKILHGKCDEKVALFKQFDASVTDELKKLEDEYNTLLELLQEQEAKVSMELPLSETLQVKFKTENNSYDSQRNLYMELQAEETTLNKSIVRSTKEIARLRRMKAIAYLRAEISTMETEAETYRSERLEIREEVKALHIVFDRRWSEDKHLLEVYLEKEHKALRALEEHIERVRERNGRVNYVSDELQLNYEGLAFLVKSKPTIQVKFSLRPSQGLWKCTGSRTLRCKKSNLPHQQSLFGEFQHQLSLQSRL